MKWLGLGFLALAASCAPHNEAAPQPGSPAAAGRASPQSGSTPSAAASAAPLVPAAPERPKVYSTGYITWVYDKPRGNSPKLGALRVGGGVPLRQADALPPEGRCRLGFYAVEPHGYVCRDERTTLDANHPLVRATEEAAAPSAGTFPYRYAFSIGAPMYNQLPSPETHRRVMMRFRERPLKLGDWAAGFELLANDDPIKPDGALPSFLADGGRSPNANDGIVRKVLPHGSMLSYGRAFEHEGRVWLVARDLSIVPADRVRPYHPTKFRGVELGKTRQLPLAWVRKLERPRFSRDEQGEMHESGKLARHQLLEMSEESARVHGKTYLKLRDGSWVQKDHVRLATRLGELPPGASADRRWIYLSLTQHTLVAYDGSKPVYATLHSPGKGGTHRGKGSARNYTTPLGGFHVNWKERFGTLSPDSGTPSSFWISDVMFVQYFKQPYALHGAYWHDNFGEPMSAGCPNLSPYDAEWLFGFTTPELPAGWQAVGPRPGESTSVVVLGS